MFPGITDSSKKETLKEWSKSSSLYCLKKEQISLSVSYYLCNLIIVNNKKKLVLKEKILFLKSMFFFSMRKHVKKYKSNQTVGKEEKIVVTICDHCILLVGLYYYGILLETKDWQYILSHINNYFMFYRYI